MLEEAHELAPQNTQNAREGEQQMLGAFKRLWKLGRASGIGGTAVTQRPASLSKDITTQSEILIAHRTIGPQDVKAVGEWVKYHGEHLDILAELPTLPTGEAFAWAPEFPEGKPIGLKRTSILLRETYDSASTPKVGEQRVEPKELAAVDLERLRVKMAATIEKAKADDPRELRKQIADLKKQAADAVKQSAQTEPICQVKRVEVLTDADRARLQNVSEAIAGAALLMHEELELAIKRLQSAFNLIGGEYVDRVFKVAEKAGQSLRDELAKSSIQKVLGKLAAIEPQSHNTPTTQQPRPSPHGRRAVPGVTAARPAPVVSESAEGTVGNTGLRRMLVALAQRNGLSARQLALRTGMSASGGSFRTYLSQGRTNGWIVGGGGRIEITAAGLSALGDYAPLPEGEELQAYWLAELGDSGAAAMLRALCAAGERGLTKEELAAATNMSLTGGSFRTYLSRLRTLELITGKDPLRASEELFS